MVLYNIATAWNVCLNMIFEVLFRRVFSVESVIFDANLRVVFTRAETNILVIRIFVSKCSIRICFQQPADSFAHTQ